MIGVISRRLVLQAGLLSAARGFASEPLTFVLVPGAWHASPGEVREPGRSDPTETRIAIEQGLARLGPKEREALVLRDVEGLETAEVARILGAAEATVRSHIRNARNKLRQFCFRSQP